METTVINKSHTTTMSELKRTDVFIIEGRTHECGVCLCLGDLEYFSFGLDCFLVNDPNCRVVRVKKIHKIEIEL